MSDDTPTLEEGQLVRFTDPHHAMNGSLKSHEGDLGYVSDTERGYSDDKTQVHFLEGATKKVIDQWDIKTDRFTPVTEGEFTFGCGRHEVAHDASEPFDHRCPKCDGYSALRLVD